MGEDTEWVEALMGVIEVTPQVRTRLLIGVVALGLTGLLVATGLWLTGDDVAKTAPDGTHLGNTGVVGDLDGDGVVDARERALLEEVQVTADVVEQYFVLPERTHRVVLTPAGPDWWVLIGSLSSTTALWSMPPPPPEVEWYGLSEGVTKREHRLYDAVHLAFTTAQDASAWVEEIAGAGYSGVAQPSMRGRLVTLTSTAIDPTSEGLTGVISDEVLNGLSVGVGYWQQDWSAWVTRRAQGMIDPKAFNQMWQALGFPAEGGVWVATSPAPDAVWVGKLANYQGDQVDAGRATQALAQTEVICVVGDADCEDDYGMSLALDYMYLADSKDRFGNLDYLPVLASKNAELVVGLSPHWDGFVTGSGQTGQTALRQLGMWYTADGLLHVHPQLGEPSS